MKEYQIRFLVGIFKLTLILYATIALLVIIPVFLYKLLAWMFL